MAGIARYLTHPQVVIDPARKVARWGLNAVGAARVDALAASGALAGTTAIYASSEAKAIETAEPLAKALGCKLEIHDAMGENDRTATGFLPGPEFEATADRFFAQAEESIRGWERAVDAQARVLAAVKTCLPMAPAGDLLFVGHGAVGTLLYCALSGLPISRAYDQGPGGGGNVFAFPRESLRPEAGWQPMETLFQ